MHTATTSVVKKAALAGALLLQAYSFAPEPHAHAQLPTDSLVRAIAAHNAVLLNYAFAEGVNVNGVGAEGRTPLLQATLQRDRELVQRLLDAGADVDLADASGLTPMMAAAAQGNTELLAKLTARSGKIDAADSEGRTAAHHALAAGQYEAAKMLVPLLPAIDVARQNGDDLLQLACRSGDLQLIRGVIEKAAVPLEWSTDTRAALRLALAAHDSELTRLLLAKHPAPPTVENRAIPLLANAIAMNDRALFDELLAAGADPNTTMPQGADKEFLKLLGSNGVRDYVKGDSGVTVLMLAAALAQPEYVRALLDAKADKNRMTARYKMLALYFAARTDRWRSVQMLLGSGTAPDKLRIEISLAAQRAAVFKDGAQIMQTSCSTGREGFSTPPGQYVITDKERNHKSTIYHVEMPFFMRLNCRDFGLHAGVVPNHPASHGCIRLPSEVAQKLFADIPVGTVVMIN